MRWIPFLILAYVVMVLETSVGWLFVDSSWLGPIGPDLAAMVAVFVALYARTASDAMIAAWVLGFAVDLTTGGGVGEITVLGPMAIAYCLLAGQLWRIRDAFFRERALTQIVLTFLFVAAAHAIWVTVQAISAAGLVSFGDYARTLLQAMGVALYTAVLMPLAHFVLSRFQRLFLASPAGAGRRSRR